MNTSQHHPKILAGDGTFDLPYVIADDATDAEIIEAIRSKINEEDITYFEPETKKYEEDWIGVQRTFANVDPGVDMVFIQDLSNWKERDTNQLPTWLRG